MVVALGAGVLLTMMHVDGGHGACLSALIAAPQWNRLPAGNDASIATLGEWLCAQHASTPTRGSLTARHPEEEMAEDEGVMEE